MKVMISYPPLKGLGSPMLTQNRQFQWFKGPSYIYPVVSASATTLLKKNGFKVLWKDCIAEKLSYGQFLDNIKKEPPDVIAIETKTPVIKQHWKIIDDIKSKMDKVVIVLMGDHVTALPEESMKNCNVDFVITGGHYDILLLGLVRHLRDKDKLPGGIWYRERNCFKNNGNLQIGQDLDSLPFADRDLTKAYLYGEKWKKRTPFFYTMAGRDCWWGKCTFCSWTSLYPEFKLRSAKNLLDEIGMLIEKHGAREIFDDTGTFPTGKWLNEFCEGMISRRYNKEILFSCNMRFGCINNNAASLMKKAGFRKLKMGLESANQTTLDRLNKGINIENILDDCEMLSKGKLDIHLTVMVGYPWESREDINNTLKFARKLLNKGYIEMLQATTVVPYPSTRLHDIALEKKWFRFDPQEYERYDMKETVLITPGLSSKEIIGMCSNLYKSFWDPRFILRQFLKIKSFEDIKYLSKGAKAIWGHIRDFT